MMWLWYALGGYLILSWVVTAWILLFSKFECEVSDGHLEMFRQAPLYLKAILGVMCMFLAPLAPLLFVYHFVQCLKESRQWKKFARVHRPHLFEPKHIANMPPKVQEFIESQSPEMECLGFVNLGDYLLKPEPFVLQGRCFMTKRGESFGTILLIDDRLAISITSILENGRFIESCSIEFGAELTKRFSSTNRFAANSIPDGTIGEVYARHRQVVAEHERNDDCGTLVFEHDQIQQVMHYENTVFGEVQFEWGELDAPPERNSIIPAGEVISIKSLPRIASAIYLTQGNQISSSCAVPSN